jgi:hypothetical protein
MLSLLAIWLLVSPNAVLGVSTSFWDVQSSEEFLEGEAIRTTITAEGIVKLSPELRALSDTDELFVWTVDSGPDGKIYAGTGNRGKVLVVEGDSARVIYDSIELEILSLAFDRDGNVYAGTSPDGLVYKIAPSGEASTFFDCPETYVWDLLVDDSGNVYAATGDLAKIYKIDRRGRAEVLLESSEAHIMCLEMGENGRIVAGTQGSGLLLEVAPDGDYRVLYEAPEEEIRALVVSDESEIYLGTVSAWEMDGESNGSYGKVILVRRSGAATVLWQLDEGGIYSLALVEDGIIAGTGLDGGLYMVDWEGHSTLLARPEAEQILALKQSKQGILIGTGNPGSILALGPGLEKEGIYRSKVHEARNVARWGRISWDGEFEHGDVELMTRAGNTSRPGDDWSDWSDPYRDAAGSEMTSPPARYVQWEASLRRSGSSSGPELGEVSISYLETNLRPTVEEVTVYPQGKGYFEGGFDAPPRMISQNLPDGLSVQYSLPEAYNRPVPEEQVMLVRGLRTMRWTASDPNGDRLKFDILYKKVDETGWKPLDENLENTLYTWNTDGFADGVYLVEVVATDARDNAAGEARSHSRRSDTFVIDNTSPEIEDFRLSSSDGKIRAVGTADDALSPILSVSFSVDGSEWVSALAVDGVFDSRREEFSLTTEAVAQSSATVSVRAKDRSGNTRVISATAGER